MNSQSILKQIAHDNGTPSYVYLLDEIDDRLLQLHQVFGKRFSISYAVKSNPNIELLGHLRQNVEYLDISSEGELERALCAGWDPSRLTFTGPGKRTPELAAAVAHAVGEVVVESVEEARRLDQTAADAGLQQSILVRLTPRRMPRGFGVSMAGRPTQFGIDEELIDETLPEILTLRNLRFRGLHIYSGTQCLNSESIAENWEIFIELFRRVCSTHAIAPERLVFGSGLGIPYHEHEVSVDLQGVAARIIPQLDELRSNAAFANTNLVLELGRFLVGEAGFYLTQVVTRKESRGTIFCVCDGGMNHHLAAAGHFGSVVHRNYRISRITEPTPGAKTVSHELVGPLCTTIDTLGRGVELPALEVGDIIAFHCSGAYGLSASPSAFISHPPPKEIVVRTKNGRCEVRDVTAPAPILRTGNR